MTGGDLGDIVILKSRAARNQLNTAIRLYFREEEIESITTLAAAARRVLDDLIEHHGRDFTEEAFRRGLVLYAYDYDTGKLRGDALEREFPQEVLDLIFKIADRILEIGIEKPVEELEKHFTVTGWQHTKRKFFASLNTAANFLKHADNDPRESISENQLNYEFLIDNATLLWFNLNFPPTPEMTIWCMYQYVTRGLEIGNDDILSISSPVKILSRTAPSRRKERCLELIADLKAKEAPDKSSY